MSMNTGDAMLDVVGRGGAVPVAGFKTAIPLCIILGIATFAGCASPMSSVDAGGRPPTTVNGASSRPLNVGLFQEPTVLGGKFGGGGSGLADYDFLFAAKLVHYDHLGNPIAVLAEEVPSLEQGTWSVFEDGHMETTYRLRSGATWHDGTPFTAEDVSFTFAAIMNPELPAENREPEKFIAGVEVLDPHTVLVRWKEPYIFANAWDLEPIARHVLEPALQRDTQSFANATYWTREWVGLGPYRLADWVQGALIKGEAFDNYALGTPRIREVVIHVTPDANQAVSRMLAGTIDITLGNLIRVEEGLILKEQIEPRGEGIVMTIPTKHRYGEIQYRDPQPPPARDARVRQAMVHALDRQLLVDTLLQGLTTPADMYLAPNDAVFPAAERAVRKYPFNPNRASELLAAAGWTLGQDGALADAAGGRFELEARTTPEVQNVNEVQILIDFWKRAGIDATIELIPRARQNDQEYRARFPGVSLSATSISPDWLDKWQTERIATDANRWRGSNRGAYSRPEFDRLYREYITTIDQARRQDTLVQLIRLTSEDVTYFPLYYQIDVHAIRTGLKGPVPRWPGQAGMAFNVHEWHWE
jgi:peptide/nickel transport system substrate-binding protein